VLVREGGHLLEVALVPDWRRVRQSDATNWSRVNATNEQRWDYLLWLMGSGESAL
jgi:hypothetical protein